MTSTSVGWVLLDLQGPDALTLDHDAFDVQSTADSTTQEAPLHAAAVRGAQAIATASGHKVGSVRVTWSEDVGADVTALLKSFADVGFDNVLPIPLSQATQTWGIEDGRANEHDKTALCVLEPGTATVTVVATDASSVRTAVTHAREQTADLVEWLRAIFERDGWLPESLHLVGSRDDLDAVAGPIGDALPIPVFDSVDTQLALALGAALVTVSPVGVRPSPAETPGTGRPLRRDRPSLVSHAKRVIISAAAVTIIGAALSLAAGSALNAENVSVSARNANPSAAGASVTSPVVHPIPAPISAPPAPPVQPLAAEPPAPAPPAPLETPQAPAEPVSVVVPEPASVPVRQQTVTAPPPAAPLAAPAAPVAPPTPIAVLPAAPVVSPAAPVTPPPAAPLAAPAAPVAPPPAAAPPALIAPSPAPEPTGAPPPQDPMGVVSNLLFGGLP